MTKEFDNQTPSAENFWLYQPHLSNELDEQRWMWMRQRFSQEQLEAAFRQIGNRRPFLVNLMNQLGERFPDNSVLPRTPGQVEAARQAAERHRPKLQELAASIKSPRSGP